MFSASVSFFVPFTITVLLYVRIFTLLLRRMTATKTTMTTSTTKRDVNVRGRCHLVTELPTRQPSDDAAGLSANVEHCHSVDARTCQANIHDTQHLTVTSVTVTTATTHSELPLTSSGHQQRRRGLNVSPEVSNDAGGHGRETAVASYRRDHREIVVSVRMAVIVVVFGGMWLGFFVVYVVHSWCSTCHIPRQLDAFLFWLGYANSSVNPILYTIFNADFRRAFRNILTACY